MRPAGRHPWWVSVCCVMMLVGCLVLPTCPGTPRAAATPPPDTPTTQVLSVTSPAPTTGHTSPDTVRNPGATTRAATGTGTDTTSPGAATSATTTTSTDADAADAARGDAVVLTEALEGGRLHGPGAGGW